MNKKLELTILSEASVKSSLSTDHEGNIYIHIEWNGEKVSLPFSAFSIIADHVFAYLDEGDGDLN